MARNILIFADGTGNEGGLIPDESRTNVYKLYRATRTGPDLNVGPSRQIAFYSRSRNANSKRRWSFARFLGGLPTNDWGRPHIPNSRLLRRHYQRLATGRSNLLVWI